jgi:hypothetical protein
MSGGQDWAADMLRENITRQPGQRAPSEELEAMHNQLRLWCDRHASEGAPFMIAVRLVDQARSKLRVAISRLQRNDDIEDCR